MVHGQGQRGFTLIEVMVAITLLMVGILAAASMQISSLGGNNLANRITQATTKASDKVEQLMALAYDDPALNDTGGVANLSNIDGSTPMDADDGSGFNVFWNVAENSPINNCKTIRVLVRRNDKGTMKVVAIDYMKMR